MQVLKPTFFPSVPRLYNRFYGVIKAKLEDAKGPKKLLIDTAVKTKLQNLHDSQGVTHAVYDKLVFAKIRAHIFIWLLESLSHYASAM